MRCGQFSGSNNPLKLGIPVDLEDHFGHRAYQTSPENNNNNDSHTYLQILFLDVGFTTKNLVDYNVDTNVDTNVDNK